MKKHVTFKVPPTRRERQEALFHNLLEAIGIDEGKVAAWRCEDEAGLARAVKPGRLTAVTYLHDPGCPRTRVQSVDVHGVERHGQCTCKPEVLAFVPEEAGT